MPAANLQGLNIVHPAQEHSDSQDLLLGQAYPDLTAQLDLWTNLSFDSEDHLGPRHDEPKKYLAEEEEEEQARSPVTGEKAMRDGHVNVVTPTNVPNNSAAQSANPAAAPQAFDFNAFLAGFGLDAFAAAAHPQQLQQPTAMAPSLAQLLALHPSHHPYAAGGPPSYNPGLPLPHPFTRPTAATTTAPPAPASAAPEPYVPAKRARTRKASVSNPDSPDFEEGGSPENSTTPLSAAEDKRRRNTAASARFRLKKKEREAALEGKAKELETKVAELERECEGLRRENGWLKGLVVGVTGAAQAPATNQGITVATPSSAPVSTGSKRRREETEAA
ncbi:unnamed protein product [Cyclocybe aegerita]|uniref:BZIP domain-containing protein n=1 Tax=Cyclocybe aegerita TaxID=1973307 RepID=A0A8S0VU99_CYCAE|nr:unnamed protein product [Cyclocybe aegerita]